MQRKVNKTAWKWKKMDSTMARTKAEQIPRETNLVEMRAEMRAHYSAQNSAETKAWTRVEMMAPMKVPMLDW